MNKTINEVLQQLRIPRRYKGYFQTLAAVRLVLEDEKRLQAVFKEVYWVVADECSCNPNTIERNIRFVVLNVWNNNREYLNKIAGFCLSARPTVSQFIDIIASHIQRSKEKTNEIK